MKKKMIKNMVEKLRKEKSMLCGYIEHVWSQMRPHPYAFLLTTTPRLYIVVALALLSCSLILSSCSTSKDIQTNTQAQTTINKLNTFQQITREDVINILNTMIQQNYLEEVSKFETVTIISDSVSTRVEINRETNEKRTKDTDVTSETQTIIQTSDSTTFNSHTDIVKKEQKQQETSVKKSLFDLKSILIWLSVCLFLFLLIYLTRSFSRCYL